MIFICKIPLKLEGGEGFHVILLWNKNVFRDRLSLFRYSEKFKVKTTQERQAFGCKIMNHGLYKIQMSL